MTGHIGQEWYRKELDKRSANIRFHLVAEVTAATFGDKASLAEHQAAREEEEMLYERIKREIFRGE